MEPKKYRRKENRLEWHFHEECRKFPTRDFIESKEGTLVQSTMVCPICKRLHAEEHSLVDDRKPKAQLGFLDSLLVQVFGS